tara:strand:+ start:1701 stop:3008 length:1308 start_codon:yes stop_codon:yes gene_type:complete
MCGFGITNIKNYSINNEKCKRRGPDLTTTVVINGVSFVHNLLHITGKLTPQPFISDNIVCTYNGEIYNYKELGDYKSDGECIIDQYKIHGKDFARYLDGEYAICIIDFSKQCVYLTSDTFAIKPLWFNFNLNQFAIVSYKSQLDKINLTKIRPVPPNTTLVFDLNTGKKLHTIINAVFNLNQYKNNYDDWLNAFSNSIKKRTANTNKNIFIGLSSGYDSGAIACELKKQNINFKSYCISNGENKQILNKRFVLTRNVENIIITENSILEILNELKETCENYTNNDYEILRDPGSMGLAIICKKARQDNRIIYLSGHGADETLTNYGNLGIPPIDHKETYNPPALFPDNLSSIFPWANFFKARNIAFLKKEEYIAGNFGIETRYPFLDKQLVQEFLLLSAALKNTVYKSCLDEYLKINNYPYDKNQKSGFNPFDGL